MRLGFIAMMDEEDFRFALKHDFPCVEFNTRPGGVGEYAQAGGDVLKWKEKYGVDLSSFGYFGAEYLSEEKETRARAIADARAAVETCAKLGAPVLVMGAGSCPQRDKSPLAIDEANRLGIEAVTPIVEKAEGEGLKVAFYNCSWSNFCVNESSWGAFLGTFPEAGIKFDPSHAIYRGEPYLAQMRDWAHRFHHVHAKGSLAVGGERYTDPPAGMDQTDWGSFFAILHAAGYQGDVNLEPHSAPWNRGEMRYRGLVFSRRALAPYLVDSEP